jgi:3-hydroxyisobutyrate dehydrogenase
MARIAFLGLGAMGSRMAANLAAAGHDLAVWNRTVERAAAFSGQHARDAATPRDAAHDAEIVIAMLRDDAASRAVWTASDTGALNGMPAAAMAIECSTLSLAWTRELAAACRARGHAFVDAPLAGSRPQAEARALIFFAGGEQGDVERVRPILLATGAAVHHAGPAASGMAVKLAVNTLFATQVAAMAELLEVLRGNGVDPARALEIVGATPVCAPGIKAAGEMMLRDAFAPQFPVELAEKDLGYAALAAADKGPLTRAAREVFRNAQAAGFGGEHVTAVTKLYRR